MEGGTGNEHGDNPWLICFVGTTGNVSGTVKDGSSGESLPSVPMIIDDTQLGAAIQAPA